MELRQVRLVSPAPPTFILADGARAGSRRTRTRASRTTRSRRRTSSPCAPPPFLVLRPPADRDFPQGTNPDFGTQDLFEAIAAGDFPSWTVYIQALSPQAAKTFRCAWFFFRCSVWVSGYWVLMAVKRRERARSHQGSVPSYCFGDGVLVMVFW